MENVTSKSWRLGSEFRVVLPWLGGVSFCLDRSLILPEKTTLLGSEDLKRKTYLGLWDFPWDFSLSLTSDYQSILVVFLPLLSLFFCPIMGLASLFSFIWIRFCWISAFVPLSFSTIWIPQGPHSLSIREDESSVYIILSHLLSSPHLYLQPGATWLSFRLL